MNLLLTCHSSVGDFNIKIDCGNEYWSVNMQTMMMCHQINASMKRKNRLILRKKAAE